MNKPKNKFKKVKWLFGKTIEIPEEWEVKTLNELDVKTTSGGTPNRSILEYYQGDIIWLKINEVNDNFIYDSEEKITVAGLENSSAKKLPKKTVLLAMYGSIGKTAILMKQGTVNQAICAFLPNKTFNEFFLQQFLINNRSALVSLGMGAVQSNLNQEVIRKFQYLLPPLSEQTRIASILSGVDAINTMLLATKTRMRLAIFLTLLRLVIL